MRFFLIPARGGSKTILDKNLVDLGGAPLIRWTLEAAKAVAGPVGAPVYVTSDDRKILDVAEGLGAEAHVRPAHLADDQATMKDVVREFLKAHPEADDVVLLYPTSPFRAAATIKNALAAYDAGTMKGPHLSLMSVGEHRGRPFGGVEIRNARIHYGDPAEAYYRKQDTPALYFANGAIFVMHRDVVDKLNAQLFYAETLPYVMYGIENLDVDTPFDLDLARAWAAAHPAPFYRDLRAPVGTA